VNATVTGTQSAGWGAISIGGSGCRPGTSRWLTACTRYRCTSVCPSACQLTVAEATPGTTPGRICRGLA
jgi:hypothetical protein